MITQRTALTRDAPFQIRSEGGDLYIEGYFAVFGSEYRMWENAVETVDPHAFDETLDGDIRALINHDSTFVLGRTAAGTLTLRSDTHGLWGSILVNQADQDAVNLYERIKRGDVSQCSFGFDIIEQDVERTADGGTRWTLRKVRLHEVSVVTFPAYEETSIHARKKDYELLIQRKNEEWRAGMRARLKGDGNNGTQSTDAQAEH